MLLVRTSVTGCLPFASSLKEFGGMHGLSRIPYSRNLWLIMKEFNVLPTDERWLKLTDMQIDWILNSMQRDGEELERRSSGMELEAEFQDYDNSWYEVSHEEFNPVREGDDEDEIARQLATMTSEEDMARLKARWEESEEVESIRAQGGTTIEEDTINELIANNVKKAMEEAKRIEKHGGNKWKEKSDIELEEEKANMQFKSQLKQEALTDAIALFNGEEPPSKEEPSSSPETPDDDFII